MLEIWDGALCPTLVSRLETQVRHIHAREYRYLYLLGNTTVQRIYNVLVNATPIQPSPVPSPLSWQAPTETTFWNRPSEVTSNTQHRTRLDNLYRIYPSVVKNHSDFRDNALFWYSNGVNALHETFFFDYDGWALNDFTSGSLVLDLGFEHNVSALRVLNSHNRKYNTGGVKELRVEFGTLSELVNIASNATLTSSRLPKHNESLAAIIDGNQQTCFTTARNATAAAPVLSWISFDLGVESNLDSILIDTGRADAELLTVYLTSNLSEVVGNSQWHDMNNGTLHSTCNGMRHVQLRYKNRNVSSSGYENNA